MTDACGKRQPRFFTLIAFVSLFYTDCYVSFAQKQSESLSATRTQNIANLDSEVIRSLQNLALVPESKWGYLFEAGGSFPALMWSDSYLVQKLTGAEKPSVRWFDSALNETVSCQKSGRYLAYAELKLPDGHLIRHSATFYAIPPNSHPWRNDTRFVLYNRSRPWWHPWHGKPHAQVDFLENLGLSRSAWEANQTLLAAWAGKAFVEFLESDPYGPVLLGFLSEPERFDYLPPKARTPEIANDELHLQLKRKILNLSEPARKLLPPPPTQEPSVELRPGSPQEAGFSPDAPQQIRQLCQKWYEESREPFAVLLARNGVIFFHEAFGSLPDGTPMTVDTPMFMASITKLMSGMLFAQFVEQGLADIDQPVGVFLPDWSVEGPKAVTFRHCFTHTTGLSGHYEFGGMHNPWLENALALAAPQLPVGQVHEYNGMGYDLAGKAMEMIAGKSAFRLMHEQIFEPLGMSHTVLDDMATCSTSTPMDIARIGQLILNGGVCGGRRFFSEKTLQRLLPCPLNTYYPAVQKDWGIGMTWMPAENPDADKTGRAYLFSSRVVGHGAASSAVFRVDLENRLIIVQTRNQAGPHYDKYLTEFLKTIDQTMNR